MSFRLDQIFEVVWEATGYVAAAVLVFVAAGHLANIIQERKEPEAVKTSGSPRRETNRTTD